MIHERPLTARPPDAALLGGLLALLVRPGRAGAPAAA
jgi:hypothetical protein